MFEEADLIFSYSRAQAIRDGVLMDVSERAKLLGYRFPVALTAAVYEAVTADAKDQVETAARVDLLLITLRDRIARNLGAGDRLDFVVKAPSCRAECLGLMRPRRYARRRAHGHASSRRLTCVRFKVAARGNSWLPTNSKNNEKENSTGYCYLSISR